MLIFTVEVTQASRCPDVRNVIFLNQLEDEIIFFLSFDGDGIHAVLAADVTCFQPIDALCRMLRDSSTVEVVVALIGEFLGAWKIRR